MSTHATGRGERAIVFHPVFRQGDRKSGDPARKLAEATGLAAAIGLQVIAAEVVTASRPRPGTLVGPGRLDRTRAGLDGIEPDLVVINHPLTPVQQRNLERAWDIRVIDRTGLILEIFGRRARTREGQLQVELAALEYRRSRLVRSWTHLERQRGGGGFTGGPGERQLELDRRLIADRIAILKRQLEQVRRRRSRQRQNRQKVPFPVVALVGYTNAGKSTLFNRLTGAGVTARDMLFTTLDPTIRRLDLGNGQVAMLADTVGFIDDLPTGLVAAFRATLEEVLEAELILLVSDATDPDQGAQRQAVHRVLTDLGLDPAHDDRIVEVANKIDLLPAGRMTAGRIAVSARSGSGCAGLVAAIAGRLGARHVTETVRIPLADGATLARLYRHGEVLDRNDNDGVAHLRVRLPAAVASRLIARPYGGVGGGVAAGPGPAGS